jgi:hypothetical protein
MKSNSASRVKDALAILKENAEEFTIEKKPKRGGVRKVAQIKEGKKKPRK